MKEKTSFIFYNELAYIKHWLLWQRCFEDQGKFILVSCFSLIDSVNKPKKHQSFQFFIQSVFWRSSEFVRTWGLTRSSSSASCRTILVRTHHPVTKVVIVTDPITNEIGDKTIPETGTFRGTETTDPLLHLLPLVTPFASILVTLTAEVTGLRLPSGILILT